MALCESGSEKFQNNPSTIMDFQNSKEENDPRKKKVGNYLLGKTLAEGSFAKVREGLHIISREKVAVKVVSKRTLLLRDYVKRRVRREVVMLQRLEHPNIIKMYEIMETENSYYLVLELAYAGDFVNYLTEKKCLSETECRKYIRQMSTALDHMHTSNIVHRDLKLENLLLDKDSNLKIIDFGSSNIFYGENSLNTQCGSPVYAAPEVFSSKKYGPAVDVWSMGVCMYAMLTGKLPFNVPSPQANLASLRLLIMKGPDIPKWLSSDCSALLSGMLTLNPEDRMTIGDILVHSWMCEGHESPLITRQPPLGKLFPTVPNNFIVNYMTNVFNYQEDDIFYSVMERKMNAVAATYQLLQKHFESGHKTIGIPPLNFEYIKDPQKETVDASFTTNTELPAIKKDKSSLVAAKPAINLFKYSSSQYQEYKPRDIKKSLTLRTRNNKVKLGKYTRTEEDGGMVPDFILTYAHNDQIEYEIPDRRYEWEQSFIVKKHGSVKSETNNKVTQGGNSLLNSCSISEDKSKSQTQTRNDSSMERQSQVCTPVNSCVDEEIHPVRSNYAGSDITASYKPTFIKTQEDQRNERMWSSFDRQRSRLTRSSSLTTERKPNTVYKVPASAPKTLTPRQAKSYFDEINRARVVGTGRTLVERCKAKSDSFRLSSGQSFKSRTAQVGHALPIIPSPDLAVDSQGILQFPVVLGGRAVTPLAPRSPPPRHSPRRMSPRYTITDGVTDVIKVQITSATRR